MTRSAARSVVRNFDGRLRHNGSCACRGMRENVKISRSDPSVGVSSRPGGVGGRSFRESEVELMDRSSPPGVAVARSSPSRIWGHRMRMRREEAGANDRRQGAI